MPAKEIRLKHLINCLYQVEIWTREVRFVLSGLDPEETVSDSADTYDKLLRKPNRFIGCPPPDDECEELRKRGKCKDKKKEKKEKKGKAKRKTERKR